VTNGISNQEVEIVSRQGWTATGVIEAPVERVSDVLLTATEGPIGGGNAPLLWAVPGAGRTLGNATLRGGPRNFTLHYGQHPAAKVEVDPARGFFRFEGGYKFAAEYRFTPHPKGTLLTYKAINVAPGDHQKRAAVRFW